MKTVVNFVGFQVGWFALVLAAARDAIPWGLAAAGAVTLIHLSLCTNRARELAVLALLGGLGGVGDTLLELSGVIDVVAQPVLDGACFVWFAALWINFGTVLNGSLRWLQPHKVASVLFGALGGPLAYAGAQALGALRLMTPEWKSLTILGGYWAVACPLALWIAARFAARPTGE